MSSKIDVVEALRRLFYRHPEQPALTPAEYEMLRAAIPIAEAMAEVCEAADLVMIPGAMGNDYIRLSEALAALRKAEEG